MALGLLAGTLIAAEAAQTTWLKPLFGLFVMAVAAWQLKTAMKPSASASPLPAPARIAALLGAGPARRGALPGDRGGDAAAGGRSPGRPGTANPMVTIALHALFYPVDTAIISSTATIFGPPFIGPVAAALKNRALVGPGLTLGLAGIALGTYLGLATAYALRSLAG
jgi:hypothetical protein